MQNNLKETKELTARYLCSIWSCS